MICFMETSLIYLESLEFIFSDVSVSVSESVRIIIINEYFYSERIH